MYKQGVAESYPPRNRQTPGESFVRKIAPLVRVNHDSLASESKDSHSSITSFAHSVSQDIDVQGKNDDCVDGKSNSEKALVKMKIIDEEKRRNSDSRLVDCVKEEIIDRNKINKVSTDDNNNRQSKNRGDIFVTMNAHKSQKELDIVNGDKAIG